MKRIFTTVLLIAMIAIGCIALYAQSDAGFLDGPAPVANPAEWTGAGWYCIDGHWPNAYIVAGPFAVRPDCSAY